MSDEMSAADHGFEDLAERLAESAQYIKVPEERIEAVRSFYIQAVDSIGARRSRAWKRVAALIAATFVLGALGGTAYASSNAKPGSPLWSLRTAGWNLRLSFTSESGQALELAEQAENAAELADEAATRCDSKGTEMARKEAISRLERAREKVGERTKDNPSQAAEVLAGVESKLAQLPPPGGPVCDESGKKLGGPPAGAAHGKPEGTPGSDSTDRSTPPGQGSPPDQGSGNPGSGKPDSANPGSGKPDSANPGSGKPGGAGQPPGPQGTLKGPPEGKGKS
jgi:hypothetical protein